MRFTNILFSPLSHIGNRQVIRTATELAARHGARLTLLGVTARPSYMQSVLHSSEFHAAIARHEREAMERELMQWSGGENPPAETMIEEGRPASAIVNRVVTAGHDLLVISANSEDTDSALLRHILRTCPCPVWVARQRHLRPHRILAAVDPTPEESELNREILLLAAAVGELQRAELHLAHAWQLYGESTLLSSGFVHESRETLTDLRSREEAHLEQALRKLIQTAGLDDAQWTTHLRSGTPANVLTEVVDQLSIDLLVLGTVARTGLAGLVMGNTAERVLDKVDCSVLALKPPGFAAHAP